MQVRKAIQLQGAVLGRTRNSGQVKKPERCVVITVTVAVAALLPFNVTEDGDTVQEAPVGIPEQVNITT